VEGSFVPLLERKEGKKIGIQMPQHGWNTCTSREQQRKTQSFARAEPE
jgi:hypothetical protein